MVAERVDGRVALSGWSTGGVREEPRGRLFRRSAVFFIGDLTVCFAMVLPLVWTVS